MSPTFPRTLALWIPPLLASVGVEGAAAAKAVAGPFVGAQQGEDYAGIEGAAWRLLGPLPNPEGNNPAGPSELDKQIEKLAKLEEGETWEALEEEYEHTDGADYGWSLAGGAEAAKTPRDAFDSGRIDLAAERSGRGGAGNAAYFLYTTVVAPEARTVTVHFGSDDGARLWLNGKLLVDRNAGRAVNPNDETVQLELRKGRNHLLAKVANGVGASGFQMIRSGEVGQLAIDAAIERGVGLILERQLIDGSWEDWSHKYRNGQTALCVYTLLKCGVPPEHPAVLKALAFLRSSPTTMTYSVGCLLMALDAAHRPQDREWMEELVADLLDWQDHGGGWAYPAGTPDLSITQYAVLGLRAAESSGIEVPEEAWEDAMKFVLRCQQRPQETPEGPEAAFHYHHGRAWTASMTTAGLATLGIIRDRIGEDLKKRDREELEEGIAMGLRWMGARMATQNHGADAWHRYYLYGLERAGALLGAREIGGVDWYRLGARALVQDQKPSGAWEESHHDGRAWIKMHDSDTCFALLFLRRATSAPVTQDKSMDDVAIFSDKEAGAVELQIVNRPTAVLTVRRVAPEALPEGVAVKRARFLARRSGSERWEELGAVPAKRMTMPYRFPLPGLWQVQVVVEGEDGSEARSGIVELEVEVGISAEQLSYATDAVQDLLPARLSRIHASSSRKGDTPQLAVDSAPYTSWSCANDDAAPELSIELRSSTKVDRILFTHVVNRRHDKPGPRPKKVELWIDRDKEPLIVKIDASPLVKSELRFEETRKIRRLRLRIVELHEGTLGAANAGFASIELLGPRR